jgi:hypothetical protein
VNLGDKLGAVRVPGPTTDFRSGLRAQLLAAAERDGIGATAVNPEPAKPRRRSRARIVIIAGIVGSTLAGSGISMASAHANPGDALYSVKRATEKAQLALAGSDLLRARLSLKFAGTRLDEARAVSSDADSFDRAMVDMDADTVDGVRLLTTAAMAHKDPAALDAVDRFVDDQRSLVKQLTAAVGAGGRATIGISLALLDSVAARSHTLRTALACDARASTADSLGPLPQPCPLSTAEAPSAAQKALSTAGETVAVIPRLAANAAARSRARQDGAGAVGSILGDPLSS